MKAKQFIHKLVIFHINNVFFFKYHACVYIVCMLDDVLGGVVKGFSVVDVDRGHIILSA